MTGQVVPGGVEAQAELALKNLKAVLEAGGSSLSKVVKATVLSNHLALCMSSKEVF